MRDQETIMRQFNRIPFADAKLHDLSFERVGREDRVRIAIDIHKENKWWIPSILVFKECFFIRTEINLVVKRQASDQLEDGSICRPLIASEWTLALANKYSQEQLEGYLHFGLELFSPGGGIYVVAKDFVLEPWDPEWTF